ncbi:MAG: glycine cleavage system protein GcvH [SAR86 cluster bacterium]|jgi:glycine cleavage system H protein|uniref:Glycine cleavage system H protein n=1 Tax=SAR86 cluster bacterium TaxID=2030880 RepID=A0A520M3I3_9GAMM|nr:MAG: glycine cleavage system protein GcvH [SAR86 cluster bacterium]
MNETPGDLKFLASHEWIKLGNDNVVMVGISDHAQEQLGDIVFIELPGVGDEVISGDEVAVIESVKAASEVYSPFTGEVIEVNDSLEQNPELVNTSPYEDGWFFKLKVSDENLENINSFMNAENYLSRLDNNS